MSGTDKIISDKSLHQLLQYNMLFGTEEDMQPILNMESTIAFSQDISFLPTLPGEARLMKNLASRLGRAFRFKLFLGGLAVTAGIGIYASSGNDIPSSKEPVKTENHIQAAPPSPLEDDEVPVPPPGINPSVPAPWTIPVPITQGLAPEPSSEPQGPVPIASGNTDPQPDDTMKRKPVAISSTSSPATKTYTHVSGGLNLDTMFSGITRLEVSGGFCDIVVKPADGDKETRLKASAIAEIKGVVFKKPEYYFSCERVGNTLKVGLLTKGEDHIIMAGKSRFEGLMEFEVPYKTELVLKNSGDMDVRNMDTKVFDLHSSYGHILCDEIKAPVHISSNSGNVALSNITGNIDCRSSYGDQNFKSVQGNIVSSSGSGDVVIEEVSGRLDMVCRYGDVDAKSIYDDITIKSSSGYVNLKQVHCRSIEVSCSYGAIWLENSEAEVRFRSSSGNVKIINNTGNVDVSSSYGHIILKDIIGNTKARASSGNITAQNMDGNLDFAGSYSNVEMDNCQGNISVSVTSGNITGKKIQLNNNLTMRTSYGNIHMQILNHVEELSFELATSYGHINVNKDGLKMEGKEGKLTLSKGKITVQAYSSSGNQLFD